jgi:hypothetical protein
MAKLPLQDERLREVDIRLQSVIEIRATGPRRPELALAAASLADESNSGAVRCDPDALIQDLAFTSASFLDHSVRAAVTDAGPERQLLNGR